MTASPHGRTGRAAVMSVVCACLGAVLAGCSSPPPPEDPDAGTNGVGRLSAAKIEKKALAAAGEADAVRLSGSVLSKGRTYKLEMRLSGDGGRGEVTSKGTTYELLRVGEDLYLKADADFWSSDAGSGVPERATGADGTGDTAADKLDDKYVKVPQDDPAYEQLSVFTDMEVLLEGLLTLHGTTAKGERTEIDGIRAIEVTGDKGAGGAFDVSLEGAPYPLRVERAGDAGTLRLSEWGKAFDLAAPEDDEIVDYGKQLPSGG